MTAWQSVHAGGTRVGFALGLVLLVAGCASIVGGQTQVVSVDTPGCAGARCELSNDKGRFFVASTPGTVSVSRSYNNLQVTCTLDGVHSEPVSVASTTKAMAFGNILFGGLIGAGVDASTGAAYDYPQLIHVPMPCAAPGAVAATPPKLGLRVDHGPAGTGGVQVIGVEADSAAARAGLLPDDLILGVNGRPVASPDGLAAALADPQARPPWTLTIRRAERTSTVVLDPVQATGITQPAP